MSNALISPQLLDRMRKIANRGLQTRVTHLVRIHLRDQDGINPYGDDTDTWATAGEHMGWIKQPKLDPMNEGAADAIAAIGTYRLHLKSDVVVDIGDQIVINDNIYYVMDTNLENTYRVFTTLLLRRRQ